MLITASALSRHFLVCACSLFMRAFVIEKQTRTSRRTAPIRRHWENIQLVHTNINATVSQRMLTPWSRAGGPNFPPSVFAQCYIRKCDYIQQRRHTSAQLYSFNDVNYSPVSPAVLTTSRPPSANQRRKHCSAAAGAYYFNNDSAHSRSD